MTAGPPGFPPHGTERPFASGTKMSQMSGGWIFKGSETPRQEPGTDRGPRRHSSKLSQGLGGIPRARDASFLRRSLGQSRRARPFFNHDPNGIFGRTTSGTLRLYRGEARLASSIATCLTRSKLATCKRPSRAGIFPQCSFGFFVDSQKWSEGNGLQRTRPANQRWQCANCTRSVPSTRFQPITASGLPRRRCGLHTMFRKNSQRDSRKLTSPG